MTPVYLIVVEFESLLYSIEVMHLPYLIDA